MKRTIQISLGAIATGLALVASATTAQADPTGAPDGSRFSLVCDNGNTYRVVTNGNGDFTPAHDLDSTSTLVPTSFGPFHGVVTDANGQVIDEFTDPGQTKGNSTRNRHTSTSCTFSFHDTFDDPDLGTLTFTGSGTVTGFVTPAR